MRNKVFFLDKVLDKAHAPGRALGNVCVLGKVLDNACVLGTASDNASVLVVVVDKEVLPGDKA